MIDHPSIRDESAVLQNSSIRHRGASTFLKCDDISRRYERGIVTHKNFERFDNARCSWLREPCGCVQIRVNDMRDGTK